MTARARRGKPRSPQRRCGRYTKAPDPAMAVSTDIHKTLEKFNYGIYIVTSLKDGAELTTRNADWVSASAMSWVTQVSFEPHLLAVGVQKDSNLSETIQRSKNFAVHILSEEDRPLVKDFDHPAEFTAEQVNGHSYTKGQTGAPILSEGLGVVECKLHDALTLKGDHMLFIGEVVAAELRRPEAQSIALEETKFEYGG